MAAMSERQLDDAIRSIVADVLRKFPYTDPLGVPRPRLLAYHTHDSRKSPAGFPDWTFAGLRGVMFRENKNARRPASPMQRQWLHTLRLAGLDAAVWRPADLESGLISYELLRLAGLSPAAPRVKCSECKFIGGHSAFCSHHAEDLPPGAAPAPVVRFSPAAEALINKILEGD